MAAGAAGVLVYQAIVPSTPAANESGARGAGPGGFGGRGSMGRPPLLVETATVGRHDISEELMIVGNLTGAVTVEVATKVSGRLRQLDVRIGDRVSRGQEVARVEDDEIQQQVSQAEASFEVASATVRQRESDLALAEATRARARSLFERSLLSRQELDDEETRFQAATAQLDLARAQFNQAQARLEELRIMLANTVVASPVNGFVGRRYLDPGAYVTQNSPIVSLVDISLVRMVANLVEKDLRRVQEGVPARIEVDAFPGETFTGEVARTAPVLDPATRTAEIEIEVPNRDYRLKPGMYARVYLSVGQKSQALVVPRKAVVMRNGARGVFLADTGEGRAIARFVMLAAGLEDDRYVEVTDGLSEGDVVVTTGAAGLQSGDSLLLQGTGPPRRERTGSPDPAGQPNDRPSGGSPSESPEARSTS